MNVNGTDISLEEMTPLRISKMLQHLSPSGDGVGIEAVLTEEEENALEASFPSVNGQNQFLHQLRTMIAHHAEQVGKPVRRFSISYLYLKRVLKTEAS